MDFVHGTIEFPDRPAPSWQAGEVVRELDDRPHLLIRILLRGGAFPHLDAPPFVRVMGRNRSVQSWFADVAEDQTSLSGYFPLDAPITDGVVEYGYGNRVFGRVPGPFDPLKLKRLDRDALPENLREVTEKFVRAKESGRLPPDIRMPSPRRRRRS